MTKVSLAHQEKITHLGGHNSDYMCHLKIWFVLQCILKVATLQYEDQIYYLPPLSILVGAENSENSKEH